MVVSKDDAERTIDALAKKGENASIIGKITSEDEEGKVVLK